MNFAIIENKIVVNVIFATPEFIAEHYPNAVELDEFAGIGWTYDKGKFVAPKPVFAEEVTE